MLRREKIWPLALIFSAILFMYLGSFFHRCQPLFPRIERKSQLQVSTSDDDGPRDDKLLLRRQKIMTAWDLEGLVEEGVENSDPRLVGLVRELLDPPSTRGMVIPRRLYETPQAKKISQFFKNNKQVSRPLFYVECGALDGERSSNTIVLETKGWEGLLIEADSYMYTQLLGKNRRAWSINACLSPTNKTQIMSFNPNTGRGHLVLPKLKSRLDRPALQFQVPCFTLETVMLALERSTIHYFSLDVEGVELDILKTIPFQTLDIRAASVEYNHVEGGIKAMTKFMKTNGYTVLARVDKVVHDISLYAHDIMFVKS